MATATLSPSASAEQRLVLYNVDWQMYDRLLREFEGRHLKLNYDRGRLEIMTTSPQHERLKKLLARLLEILTLELDIPIVGFGNFTCRREDLERGLEPDECWYVEHESQMRGREEVELGVDPPPDIVLEIEVSRSVIDRLGLLAALGVPEVWCCDGSRLRVLVLGPDGKYTESPVSPSFPSIPLAGFADHLQQRGATDETTIVRSFQMWVRKTAGVAG